jgi:polyisoprenoid-binding protein YceI
MNTRTKLAIAVPVALGALVVGGTWVYIHVVEGDAPPALELSADGPTSTASAGTTSGASAGTWKTANGSEVGYRVDEVLFGQQATAVGRTERVTGEVTLDGATVSKGDVHRGHGVGRRATSRGRDGQYRNRIMSTDQFPTATFALTRPIDLGGVPADGVTVTAKATGDLTLRGVTKSGDVRR